MPHKRPSVFVIHTPYPCQQSPLLCSIHKHFLGAAEKSCLSHHLKYEIGIDPSSLLTARWLDPATALHTGCLIAMSKVKAWPDFTNELKSACVCPWIGDLPESYSVLLPFLPLFHSPPTSALKQMIL